MQCSRARTVQMERRRRGEGPLDVSVCSGFGRCIVWHRSRAPAAISAAANTSSPVTHRMCKTVRAAAVVSSALSRWGAGGPINGPDFASIFLALQLV